MASDSRDGIPAFPPSFEQLLTHRNVCFINIGAHADIDDIIKSFFRSPIDGISYVEAASFFELAWGSGWSGGQPNDTPSLLSVIERAFPGFTMNKNPNLTCGNWLNRNWSIAMTRYALEDVIFLAEAVRNETRKSSFDPKAVDGYVCVFPEKLKKVRAEIKKEETVDL